MAVMLAAPTDKAPGSLPGAPPAGAVLFRGAGHLNRLTADTPWQQPPHGPGRPPRRREAHLPDHPARCAAAPTRRLSSGRGPARPHPTDTAAGQLVPAVGAVPVHRQQAAPGQDDGAAGGRPLLGKGVWARSGQSRTKAGRPGWWDRGSVVGGAVCGGSRHHAADVKCGCVCEWGEGGSVHDDCSPAAPPGAGSG